MPGIEELKSAGLLDKRPAIDAYRISGELVASAADVAHNDGVDQSGEEEDELPLAADLSDDVPEVSDAT